MPERSDMSVEMAGGSGTIRLARSVRLRRLFSWVSGMSRKVNGPRALPLEALPLPAELLASP